MPEESKRVGALTGERTLSVMIPAYTGDRAVYSTAKGWNPVNGWFTGTTARGLRLIAYETYFDLQGYELDDLTLMPLGALLQDPGSYQSNDTNTPIMEILDIISQERLSVDEVAENIVEQNMPGMLNTQNNFTQITFGRYRLMLNQAEYNETGTKTWLVGRTQDFGSGEPVTVQKLWVYRFIRFLVNDGKDANIPASRFILSGATIKEKDLVYLQRLKRSYELQGRAD